MKNLACTKIYVQFLLPFFKKPLEYISTFFALVGGYFTFCEIEQAAFKTQMLIGIFRNHILGFLVILAMLVLLLRKEKAEKTAYLGEKDTIISLKMANLLNIKESAIVIPTNTTFDTTMSGDFISEQSLQGQFQKNIYGVDFSELDKDIKNSLDENYTNYKVLEDRRKTNKNRYEIGTVAKITYKRQHYYFLAVADVSKTGKPQNVTMQNMAKALVGLWEYLSKEGHTEPITIPVIGTGRAGLCDGTFEDVVHETIFSFATKSQDEFVARKMTICVYPPALSDANVTWEKLCNYLELQCQFFTENEKRIKNSRITGSPVS
ncbi:macro domain-containing protein [Pseudoramibacter alactolyticus]|uniref:macro domain-containing protein n=1 Tax=Pseudoramibacter alactolyticus TaxID=113287 RepID=UPI00248F0ADC|nr:macro domain-containing protein [Pseudoramibacter alactolyticus]